MSESKTECPKLPTAAGVLFAYLPEFPGYCAGSDGSIWSCRKKGGAIQFESQWRKLKPNCGWQYQNIKIARLVDGKLVRKTQCIHHLILEAFVGPRPTPDHQSCHANGNMSDNRLDNLRWDTKSANAIDSIQHGSHAASVMSEEKVRKARRDAAAGVPLSVIASEFGVQVNAVEKAIKGRTWSWVK